MSPEPLLSFASLDPAAPAAESVSAPLPNMALLVLRGLCIASALLVLAAALGVWLVAAVFHTGPGGLA